MRFTTILMDKIFSDSTPEEFKSQVSDKIEEAKANGEAELKSGKENLKFTENENGDVEIKDVKNDEVTLAKDEGDGIKLEGVAPETKAQSATQPDVVVTKPEGEDKVVMEDDETLPDVKVTVKEAIIDPEKAGTDKNYSLEFSGFESAEEAAMFYSEVLENAEAKEDKEANSGVNFSEEELQEVADKATEAKDKSERVQGTGDPNTAFSLLEDCSELRAYSELAMNRGIDCSDILEAVEIYSDIANEALDTYFSELDVNEYFSDMDEDQVTAYFSGLDEVESNVLYSVLESGENYTFSEVEDIVNQVYSEAELEQSVVEVFSELTEDEIDAIFSELSEDEANILYSALEDESVTFSEVNEALNQVYVEDNLSFSDAMSELSEDEMNSIFSELTDTELDVVHSALNDDSISFSDVNDTLELLNTPVTELFSNMDEDDVELFSETYGDELTDIAFSMALNEDEVYTFSDAVELYEALNTFSEEDAKVLGENIENIGKACEDCKATKDVELAKKVKVLADKTAEDIEKAEEAGYDTEKAKEMCARYSEEASDVLVSKGVNPEKVDKQEVLESIEKDAKKEEASKEGAKSEEPKKEEPKKEEPKKEEPKEEPKKEIKVEEPKKEEGSDKQFSFDGLFADQMISSQSSSDFVDTKIFGRVDDITYGSDNSCLISPIN